jgi:hypothetical protein
MDIGSLNAVGLVIGIVASVVAAVIAVLSYLLLKVERTPHHYIKEETLQPGNLSYTSPNFPQHASKNRVENVSLLINNVNPVDFYVVSVSNLNDLNKIIELSRDIERSCDPNRGLEEGDIEGKLYFPLIHLDTLKHHPNCEVRIWNEEKRQYNVVINLNLEPLNGFYFCFGNEVSADREVIVSMIISAISETTPFSRLKARL